MGKPKKINLFKEAKELASAYTKVSGDRKARMEVLKRAVRPGSPVRVIMTALVQNELLKTDKQTAQKWLADCLDLVSQ